VGSAFAAVARRRSFFEHCALADYDPARPASLVAGLDDGRFSAHGIDALSKDAVASLIRDTRADAVLNAVDPLFNVPIFDACFEAGVTYLDMAMTLSEPHPTNPYEEVGVKLGDYQFERAKGLGEAWSACARGHRHRARRSRRVKGVEVRRATSSPQRSQMTARRTAFSSSIRRRRSRRLLFVVSVMGVSRIGPWRS